MAIIMSEPTAALRRDDDPTLFTISGELAPLIGREAVIALVRALSAELSWGKGEIRLAAPHWPVLFR
jgi:hypothetical protein